MTALARSSRRRSRLRPSVVAVGKWSCCVGRACDISTTLVHAWGQNITHWPPAPPPPPTTPPSCLRTAIGFFYRASCWVSHFLLSSQSGCSCS